MVQTSPAQNAGKKFLPARKEDKTDKKYSNPCSRCGKERIFAKTWNESIPTVAGSTTIVHTKTICPDPDCQKIVEEHITAQAEKRAVFNRNLEEKAAAIKAKRIGIKISKS